MKTRIAFGIGLLLIALSAGAANAHSLESFQNQLYDDEPFFQAVDREVPEFSLFDAEGEIVDNSSLLGKVVVLFFVYTNCPDVCPLQAETIAKIQKMVNISPMRDLVEFVTITTDPEFDTPDIMRAYGPNHGLDPVNWTFLTSGPERLDDTRELARLFGPKFTVEPDGYQVHGTVTQIIDMEGRWRGNFHGLNFEPTNMVLFINALTNANYAENDRHADDVAAQPGFWNRMLSFFGV